MEGTELDIGHQVIPDTISFNITVKYCSALLLWIALLWIPSGQLVWAEETEESGSEEKDTAELKEGDDIQIVVTASKHGQKITEAPAAVTVISSEDIAASGAVAVADLFRRVPGLDFIQISARDYNVNARGFNGAQARRLLVLVDGRSVYVDLMGFTMWDTLPFSLDEIERIEVVRGPGSALYGANASSGVVNIITKSPGAIDGLQGRVGYGEANTIDGGLVVGKQVGKFGYKASASYYTTEPFESPDYAFHNPDFERDEDQATEQPKAMFRGQYDLTDTRRLLFDAGYAATSGILLTGIGPLDIQPGSYVGFFRGSYTSSNFYVQAFWNGLDGDTVNGTTLQENTFHTDSYDLEVQYNHPVGRHFLVLGGNVRYSDITTDLASKDESEVLYGIYLQDDVELAERWDANVALRVDRDELIGTVAAPKAGIVYSPTPTQSWRLTAATAYNSSSFVETYLDYTWSLPVGGGNSLDIEAYGNPDLKPERNTTYEAGLKWFPKPFLMLDVTLFHSRLKDFVQFTPVEFYTEEIPKSYTYVNADRAEQTGLEVASDIYLGEGIALFANYSYTDTSQREDVGGTTAKNKGGLTLHLWRDRLRGSLGVVYSDERVYTSSTIFYQAETLPSYTVVNGSVQWDILDEGRLAVGLRGTNLLNNEHREYIAGDIIERRVLAELKFRLPF